MATVRVGESAVVLAAVSVAAAGVPVVVAVALPLADGELQPAMTSTQMSARVAIGRRCMDMIRDCKPVTNNFLWLRTK
jgi:hypothetical protein